ncbi:hypothetical protein RYZ26_17155 [Terasakiella sp. A23]|uniref:hypothetical protein n=1 Tax=Terasakiella sp. FCG-A23 TaxID=3080561 RepID=UPI0029541628|nr:hypothetical protein [Terasakiella sp. A23]MDV7341340.1 hypothetical protein [Terasakiella sp. A23]
MQFIKDLTTYHQGDWIKQSIHSNGFKGVEWQIGQSVYSFDEKFCDRVQLLIDQINPSAVVRFGPKLIFKGQRMGGGCIGRNQILVSFCSAYSPIEILRHELFHSVFGALTPEEQSFLQDDEESLATYFQDPKSKGYLEYKDLFQMVEKGELFKRMNDFI